MASGEKTNIFKTHLRKDAIELVFNYIRQRANNDKRCRLRFG